MKTVAAVALVLSLAAPAWAQSLFQGDGSPNDPPKKAPLRMHDHVQIQFADPARAAGEGERRVRWDKELRDWARVDAREGGAAASLAAEVVDVRPNGTLVLQAVKRRMVNRDEEIVRLTCEVAPENVSQNRTTSDRLANLTMTYDGAGVDGTKPGLLGWLFGKLWPF